jgi:hypothetical protein
MNKTLSISGGIVARTLALAAIAAASTATPSFAQTPPAAITATQAEPAPSIQAFQSAYAVSFYGFDACGDQVAGRIFRKALADKLAACPFAPALRTHFQQWSAAQRARSSRAIAGLIDRNGGLPVKLDGMNTTCREQRASPTYIALRDRLEQYAAGTVTVDTVIPESCDAPVITP